jgi:peptide/nickel transport system substrate-binding protein
VVHTVVPDDAARVALVERGEADAADHVPLEEVERLSRNPAVQVVAGAGLRVLFLGLRVDRPPFSDPRVREAIDLALDRAELARRALGGRAEPATQLVPPSIVGFDPALRLPAPDAARARALLASAGHRRGLDVRLDGPSNRYVSDVAILRELARQLGEVGVRVTVNALDKRDFFPLIERGGSAMHLLGWACESGDAGDVLGSLAHSPTGGALGSLNSLGLADRALDGLIGDADRARTDRERARRLRLAVARVAGLRAALPLVVQTEAVVLSRRLAWEAPLNMALSPEDLRPAP